MDYALAKRIKDAGWPQPEFDIIRAPLDINGIYRGGGYVYENDAKWDDQATERAYAPTTDELIEALGDQLHATFHGAGLPVRVYRTADSPSIEGETLQIALAELWLTPEVQEAINPCWCAKGS
jgi:hypothetical protein